MIRRATLLPFLVAAPLLLAVRPALADMVIEITNQSPVQFGVAISGSNVVWHVIPGQTHSFPASEETRTVEIVLSDNSVVCAGQAVVTTSPVSSFCAWVDTGGANATGAKCNSPWTSGNGTRQCRVGITVSRNE